MENQKATKFKQDLQTLYDWVSIILNQRKFRLKTPAKAALSEGKHDLRQFFNLLKVPCTEAELNILCASVQTDPKKPLLSKEEIVRCFAPDEQAKRKHNRQLKQSINFLVEGKDKIPCKDLRDLIKNYSDHPEVVDTISAQLSSCESDGQYNVQALLDLLIQ